MKNKPRIFSDLERLAPLIPVPVSWVDVNGTALGGNDLAFEKVGDPKLIIGKTLYDFFPNDVARPMMERIKKVIQEKKIISFEEQSVETETGKVRWFVITRAPLFEDEGINVVGVVATAIEITERKEAEWLRIENELQKAQLQEQLKFKKLVDQAANDVQSPLAILLVLVQQCIGLTKDAVFETIERLADVTPVPVYWLDENNAVLGANKLDLEAVGCASVDIGKTPYDLLPPEMADPMVKHNNLVMHSGKILSQEEQIRDFTTGQTKYFTEFKAPLYDNNGKTIGILGTAVDITAEKNAERLKLENEKQKAELEEQAKLKKLISQAADDIQLPFAILLIFIQRCSGLTKDGVYESIEKLAEITPIPLYWFNENNVLVGNNKLDLQTIGAKSSTGIVGKTQYEYLPLGIADKIVKHNNLVMQTGKILSQDSSFNDLTTGKLKYFTTFKAPLYDNTGKVIGILCTTIDSTAVKEAESLKQQTERQAVIIEEQNKFKKITDQVVHDIRSPLASLAMMLKVHDKDIPEQIRIPLRDAAANISDIANTLLGRYGKDDATMVGVEEQQPVMISLTLSQLLSDKKHQYKETDIKFTNEFSWKCIFTFIKVQPSSLKRMLSNLVNNAVEALEGKKGMIHLDLSMDQDKVKIVVQDNGKGMPKEIIDKILSNAAVATDKKEGHGIGFGQIRETITNNQGKLGIESKLGEGTKVILTFSIIEPPDWIAEDIKINKGDTIVILDDDRSIHGAWDSRFKGHLNEVQIKHFLNGNKVMEFINTYPEKEKIFLLTDYELLKQDINGIDIIQKTNIKRAILVTSHHAEVELRNTAVKNGIKILPKQLAPEVPIEICEADKICISAEKPKKIDIVVIDDDEILGHSMILLFKKYNKTADRYPSPKCFLEKISQYAKDTKIFTDNSFGANSISGVELAKQLHEKGFIKLYLFSGKDFEEGEIPDYLTVISKTDIDGLCKAIQ